MFRMPSAGSVSHRALLLSTVAVVYAALGGFSRRAAAHGISEASHQTMAEGGIWEYIWLGAEHMVTGYDHLLFLFGVIFFLTGFRDVVRFITAFTLGHCITLLGATLAGVTANAYLIDAVIALSVIYKGFENLDGFQKTLGIRAPNLLTMVFLFGLIHGFGLSTRLQELPLGEEGLVGRILAFNVGVELGQVAALTVMLAFFKAWRASQTFERFSNLANSLLVLAGAGLFVYQVNGYLHDHDHGGVEAPHEEHAPNEAHHDDAHHDDAHPVESHEHAPAEEAIEEAESAASDPSAAETTEPPPTEEPSTEPKPKKSAQGHSHSHSHGGHSHTHKPKKEPAEE